MRGACSSNARGTETAEVKVLLSGGCPRVPSSTEDGQVVAVMGTPKVLVAGKPEVLKTVTGIPEAVGAEIPKVPTT